MMKQKSILYNKMPQFFKNLYRIQYCICVFSTDTKDIEEIPQIESSATENGEQHPVKVKGEANEGTGTVLTGQTQV